MEPLLRISRRAVRSVAPVNLQKNKISYINMYDYGEKLPFLNEYGRSRVCHEYLYMDNNSAFMGLILSS